MEFYTPFEGQGGNFPSLKKKKRSSINDRARGLVLKFLVLHCFPLVSLQLLLQVTIRASSSSSVGLRLTLIALSLPPTSFASHSLYLSLVSSPRQITRPFAIFDGDGELTNTRR